MSALALVLVLTSAVLHASWNLLAKRAGTANSIGFIWLNSACAAVIFIPTALGTLLIQKPELGAPHFIAMLVSAILHLGYFTVLQRGYRTGDLSLVYPLARGTGPMLSTVLAILLFSERPTLLALTGAAFIGIGVFLIASSGYGVIKGSGGAILYALITGGFIAAYTLWDKRAVGELMIAPLIFDWVSNFFRMIIFLPLALKNRGEVVSIWHKHRREVLGVAVLSPIAYVLVLVALSFSPVSYIAPAREISILIGAMMGSRLLGEGNTRQRLIAAGLMTCGVIFLAVG